MTGRVLFVSQNDLERAENLKAVFDAYDGEKEFRKGAHNMRLAEKEGFSVVVCDALPDVIYDKHDVVSINTSHGITGNKIYGIPENREWCKPEAYRQTDIAITASESSIPICAGSLGIPEDRVLALGIPRTDAYFGKLKGDGMTLLGKVEHAYLYVPTFRDPTLGGYLPEINWDKLDTLLHDDELLVVKRHYFTESRLVPGFHEHIVEISRWDPLTPYLLDADVIVTDYSSVMFDGYLMGKPSVLVTDDADGFLKDRPMCYDYPSFYGSITVNINGNVHALVAKMREAYRKRHKLGDVERKCIETVASACDGHATERVVDLIRRHA